MFPSALDRLEALRRRMAAYRDGLTAPFASLYGTHKRADAALLRLIQVIETAALARPDALWRLDFDREARPTWYLAQTELGYCCYVDRFAGTLAGLQDRIPYLKEMGVTYLHLLPFWQRRPGASDGGFAVSDHERVDPSLGSNADLIALTTALAEAGITLCSDLVLNHTADDHRWAEAAKAGDETYRAFYRVFPTRDLPDQFERTVPQVFPETAPGNFTFVPEVEGWVWTSFYPYQWDLNWENPDVLVEMVRIILGLANLGIGAFRLDSAPFLWKRLGTTCQNLPETHMILRLIRAAISIAAPSVLLKAEAVVPSQELPPYFGLPDAPGEECQLAYQTSIMAASWAAIAHQDASLLHQVLSDMPALGEAGTWLTYARCHDDIGWRVLAPECRVLGDPAEALITDAARFFTDPARSSFARGVAFQSNGLVATNGMAASLCGIEAGVETGDLPLVQRGIDRVVLLYGLIFAVGGLPVIYMGDELGQTNATLPPGETDGRWLHRPAFDAAAAAQRHDPATVAGQLFSRIVRLASLRRARSDLAGDQLLRLLDGGAPGLCCFARGEGFLAVLNFSDAALPLAPVFAAFRAMIDPAAVSFHDLIADEAMPQTASIDPWRVLWLIPTH